MIITIKGADFSESNINSDSTWSILKTLGTGATSSNTATYVDKGAAYNTTITIASGYELGAAGVTVTMGGTVITPTISDNIITISISAVTGNVIIRVPTVASGGGDVEPDTTTYTFTINPTPTSATVTLSATGYSTVSGTGSKSITVANGTTVNWTVSASGYTTQSGTWTASGKNETENVTLVAESGSGGGTTTVDYGTLISNPSNLRGGAVDYIIVRPEFYTSILNKKITKIRVYKVADSDASKTTIGIGKVALSGEFASTSQTVSGLETAYSNISNYKTYNVASYTNKTMMELDCDITLTDGEYLCFETKNGHCVGYCNNQPNVQQMMYIYSNKVCPEDGLETSQQVPISVTVEE